MAGQAGDPMYGGGCGGDGDVGGEGGGGKHNGDLTSVESPCSGTFTCGKCLLLGYSLRLIITLNISWPMHVFSLCIH